MRHVRDVIRLKSAGMPTREIARGPGTRRGYRRQAEPDWAAVHRELKRKHVTLSIVWEEYIAGEPPPTPTPTPSSTDWSITPTGSISWGRACGEAVNPAERPEQVALWTCRCAWTTQQRCPHAHSRSSRKTSHSSRDSRLTSRLPRCQKPNSQNARAPGDIKSEWWARSSRNPGRDQIGTPGRDHRDPQPEHSTRP
jgi:hypothetical protein